MKLLVSKLIAIICLFSITLGQEIKQDQNLPNSNQVERLKLRIRLSRQKLVELRQKISKLLAQHKNAKIFKIRLNIAQSALNRLLIKKVLARRKVDSLQRKYFTVKLHKIRLRKLRSLRKLKTLRIKRRQRAIGVHKVPRQHPLLRSYGLFRINREILFIRHRMANLYRRLAYLLRLRNSKFFSRFGARRNLYLRRRIRRLRPRIFRSRRCARRRFRFPRHNCRCRIMRMLRLLRSIKQRISTRNRNRKVINDKFPVLTPSIAKRIREHALGLEKRHLSRRQKYLRIICALRRRQMALINKNRSRPRISNAVVRIYKRRLEPFRKRIFNLVYGKKFVKKVTKRLKVLKCKGRTRIVNKKTNTPISKKELERYVNRFRRATKNKIPLSCKEFKNKQIKYMAHNKNILAEVFKRLYEKCRKNNNS